MSVGEHSLCGYWLGGIEADTGHLAGLRSFVGLWGGGASAVRVRVSAGIHDFFEVGLARIAASGVTAGVPDLFEAGIARSVGD